MNTPVDYASYFRTGITRLILILLFLIALCRFDSLETIAQTTHQEGSLVLNASPEFINVIQAIDDDDYNLALEELSKLRSIAKKTRTKSLYQEVLKLKKEVTLLKREFAKVREFSEILKTNSDDPLANEQIGKFYCVDKGNWEKGLPLLSKSTQPELSQIALDDISLPDSPAEQGKLADSWWKLADKEKGRIRKAYQLRGRFWYLLARPEFTLKEHVDREKQLNQIPLNADKIVIWNQHNGGRTDRGTVECVVTLLSKGKSVWRQVTPLPWKPDAPAGQVLYPPHVRFDQIHVEITKIRGKGGGLGEIEVYDGNFNVTRNCSAIAKEYWEQNPDLHPNNVTDGDKTGVSGYWLLNNGQLGWVLVDMIKFQQQD